MTKERVLVLCTGNSCRSQMAEGYLRHYGSDRLNVYSAGITPAGLNSNAVEAMRIDGIDISNQSSTDIDEYIGKSFDLIITVCGNAKEKCPSFPGRAKRVHWPIDDPASFSGSRDEIRAKFEEVRDDIKKRVKDLLHL